MCIRDSTCRTTWASSSCIRSDSHPCDKGVFGKALPRSTPHAPTRGQQENAMNCNTLKNHAARRILLNACAVVLGAAFGLSLPEAAQAAHVTPVSYTHLTLP